MRKGTSNQKRFDGETVENVRLNFNCRDEIIPILRALQHLYTDPLLRHEILKLVEEDVNRGTRKDRGREGLDYWQILVLAAVRLGCNLNYDKLQDLAEQHRALRHIMGIGDWDESTLLGWRRIRNNVCLIRPATIERISQLVVQAGHELVPDSIHQVRADSFVMETNIHYPSESSLILDGTRKVIELGADLALQFGVSGWRQHAHLLKKMKKIVRSIGRNARSKSEKQKGNVKKLYKSLLKCAEQLLERADGLIQTLENEYELNLSTIGKLADLRDFMDRTRHVCGTAYRRVMLGEEIPNNEKLFSIFEPHTQLYKRGKVSKPIQFGRLVLIYEDGAGFVVHHHLMPREAQDKDVAVEQTRILQERVGGTIEELSFDCGFHSPENQEGLEALIKYPCLPTKGNIKSVEQMENAGVRFREARKRHSGVEAAIGAMQSGNGLKRSRDRRLVGFERYLALGILGRNLHTLGKIVIRQEDETCEAACSYRAAA